MTSRDWLTQALIKRLDNIWRTLASTLSLCLCYAGSSFYHRNFETTPLLFVVIVVMHAAGLGLARREKNKVLTLLDENNIA